MLKHLRRVFIQFTPGDPKSVSARELLALTKGKHSNPACKVEFKTDEDAAPGSSLLELEFVVRGPRLHPYPCLSASDH